MSRTRDELSAEFLAALQATNERLYEVSSGRAEVRLLHEGRDHPIIDDEDSPAWKVCKKLSLWITMGDGSVCETVLCRMRVTAGTVLLITEASSEMSEYDDFEEFHKALMAVITPDVLQTLYIDNPAHWQSKSGQSAAPGSKETATTVSQLRDRRLEGIDPFDRNLSPEMKDLVVTRVSVKLRPSGRRCKRT